MKPLDPSHSLLWLERESRMTNGFDKNPNCEWASFKKLEQVFLDKFPNHEKNTGNIWRGRRKNGGIYSEKHSKNIPSPFIVLKIAKISLFIADF
jgi:hypothetical protein